MRDERGTQMYKHDGTQKLNHFIGLPSSPGVLVVFGGALAGKAAAVFGGASSSRSYPGAK